MTEQTQSSAAAVRRGDPVWEQAMDWFLLVRESPEDDALRQDLELWLVADESHRTAFHKVQKVWALTGDALPQRTRVAASAPPQPVQDPAEQTEGVVPERQEHRQNPSAPSATGAGTPKNAGTATVVPLAVRSSVRRSRRRWPRWAAAGVAVAACLAVFALPGVQRGLWSDYHTDTAQVRTVALADGSTVTLDAQSAVDVSLDDTLRRVDLLQGRAFFEVSPDKARPFQIKAGDTTVTVTGTAFSVAESADTVEVTVSHGSVVVANAQRLSHRQVSLHKGDRAVVGADGDITVSLVSPQQVGAWRQGRLVVNGASVAEVVARLRPYYPGLILLDGDQLPGRQVTGVFDLSQPRHVLQTLARLYGGSVSDPIPYVIRLSEHGAGAS